MKKVIQQGSVVLLAALLLVFLCYSQQAVAGVRNYPRERLSVRLSCIAGDFSVDIAFDGRSLEGVSVPAVKGVNNIREALTRTLSGTAFTYISSGKNYSVIKRKVTSSPIIKERTVVQHGQSSQSQESGSLHGRVVESETSEPIIGAVVKITGMDINSITDNEGFYNFIKIPAGRHSIEVSYLGYTPEKVNVDIIPGRQAVYDVKLTAGNNLLGEVVVKGLRHIRGSVPYTTDKLLIQEIKDLPVVASGISAEQISKSADRNAAQAVAKVAGVSIVDDKFVTVRGLSPRYNLTYLNDNVAPSTEADSRSFALDLIPSRIIDRIVVQKSPSADIQADGTGGVVKIYTKDAQLVKHFDIDLQLGYSPNTTFKRDFLTYKGGKWDWLGFDDGTRALPKAVPGYGNLLKANLTPEQYAKDFTSILSYGQKTALPNMQFTTNYYNAWNVLGRMLSSLTSFSYKNENRKDYVHRQEGIGYESYNSTDKMGYDDKNTNTVQSNLLQNFTYHLSVNHTLFFKNFLLLQGVSSTISQFRESTYNLIYPYSMPDVNKNIILSYRQHFLYAGNFAGQHSFEKGRHYLKWNMGYTFSRQDIPDLRVTHFNGLEGAKTDKNDVQYYASGYNPADADETYNTSLAIGIGSRVWTRNTEGVYNGSLDYTFNFKPWLSARFGTWNQWKTRYVARRVYTMHEGYITDPDNVFHPYGSFDFTNPLYSRFYFQNLDKVWSTEYLNNEYTGLRIFDRTSGSDTYKGTEQINSGYAIIHFVPLKGLFEVNGGLRYESYIQKIGAAIPKGTDPSSINIPIFVDHSSRLWLPSVSMVFFPTKQLLFRSSYGKTVNRPEFWETSPFQSIDYENNEEVEGNSSLISARVNNYDVRLEYYFKEESSDMISIGGFYKNLKNPIERTNETNRTTGGVSLPLITYSNGDKGTIKGIEIELRNSFDFIPVLVFRNLSFIGNLSLIHSEAHYSNDNANIVVIAKHPLQGQTPFLVNAGLYYEDASSGTKVSLIYNGTGDNIYAVGLGRTSIAGTSGGFEGPENRGSLIELGRHILDFTLIQRIGKGWQVKLTIQNLLNSAVKVAEDYNSDNKYEKAHKGVYQYTNNDGIKIYDYGDNIYSKFNPGRYFTLHVTYSF